MSHKAFNDQMHGSNIVTSTSDHHAELLDQKLETPGRVYVWPVIHQSVNVFPLDDLQLLSDPVAYSISFHHDAERLGRHIIVRSMDGFLVLRPCTKMVGVVPKKSIHANVVVMCESSVQAWIREPTPSDDCSV